MKEVNIVSVSGGKDSTATLLVALERGAKNLRAVFADTGNEHPETLKYIDYLSSETGVEIERVKADFSVQIARKRARILADDSDWPDHLRDAALEVLQPTGHPMLDMILWKGRFPSSQAKFCTQHLKREPFDQQVIEPLLESGEYRRIVSWLGVRRDESRARANALEWESEFGDPDTGEGLWIHRPLVDWTAAEVFEKHREHGVNWNPLYEQGMGRVGCMPCINARKGELREIARRFPEELERIAEWERIASDASRRGCATFRSARGENAVSLERHGIERAIDWSRTSRGGRQFDLIAVSESEEEAPMCQSLYGLCE